MNSIQHIRKNILRMTQGEMATAANVSQATVSRWESGELEPSIGEAAHILADAKRRGASLSPDDFFQEETAA